MANSFWMGFAQVVTWFVLCVCPWASAVAETPMDQEVLLRIKDQLHSDIRLRDATLDIRVTAGEVTLNGELPSFLERSRLERICRRIKGVQKVVNRITIAPVAETDQDLQRLVDQRITADPIARNSDIHIETDGTIVTLSGTVSSLYDRRHSEYVAEQVRGVTRVVNQLTLGVSSEPADVIPDELIAASIRETLGKDDRSLSQSIEFSVQKGVVTLDGAVDSSDRKRFYRYLLERIDGVRQVENHLDVRRPDDGADAMRPSLDDAALDVELALNAARIGPVELHASLAKDKIAIDGIVASLAQKQKLLRVAQAFASGFPIVDQMEVAVNADASNIVQSELARLLRTDVLLADAQIEVTINQGVATLNGNVERYADRLRAERLASTVSGIRAIDNQLDVNWTPTVADDRLQQSIERRLRSDRLTATVVDSIEVSVDHGRVKLTGRVPSWELRRQVSAVVSGTNGIRSVESELTIDLQP